MTLGYGRDDFFNDQKIQSAVIMQLALIGELVKKISETVKSAIDLPWKDIAGFRDRAIHDYYQVDLSVVWDTITTDLPELDSRLKISSESGSV
jgi:uncharacterized protein with HEPN domain